MIFSRRKIYNLLQFPVQVLALKIIFIEYKNFIFYFSFLLTYLVKYNLQINLYNLCIDIIPISFMKL
jgi:hypothetical protein